MLRDFEVQGFKKFSSLRLDNLGQINILLGKNNVGKTTVLEALFAHACGENVPRLIAESIIRTNMLTGAYDFAEKLLNGFNVRNRSPFKFFTRGMDVWNKHHHFEHHLITGSIYSELFLNQDFDSTSDKLHTNFITTTNYDLLLGNYDHIFQKNSPQTSIGLWEITHNAETSRKRIFFPDIMENTIAPDMINHLNCKFVDILSHRHENENRKIYALLKRENLLTNFVTEMSKTFGEVQGIDMLPYPDGTNGPVSVATDRGFIPLSNFGDGLQRYFHVMGGLYLYRNGIHCIEEVDATFHPEAQESFSKGLLHYSEITNNQVFMSSHNAEFVDNFLRTVSSSVGESGLEKIRVITMKDTKDSQVRVRTLTGTEALIRRNEYEMELR